MEAPAASPQEFMVGGSGQDPTMSLQVQQQQQQQHQQPPGGHHRRYSDAPIMVAMPPGRDVEDEREQRMGHGLRDR